MDGSDNLRRWIGLHIPERLVFPVSSGKHYCRPHNYYDYASSSNDHHYVRARSFGFWTEFSG